MKAQVREAQDDMQAIDGEIVAVQSVVGSLLAEVSL